MQDRAVPYFGVVAPMVYPSHYPKNFLGLGNPNDYPYKVVHYAMQFGVNRLLSSTTPMQGFCTPGLVRLHQHSTISQHTLLINYGPGFKILTMVVTTMRQMSGPQIQASYDAGVTSWMIWAPSNRYAKAALLPE